LREVHGNNAAPCALDVLDVRCCNVGGLQRVRVRHLESLQSKLTYSFGCVWSRVRLGEDANDRGVVSGCEDYESAGQECDASYGRCRHGR